MKAWIHYLVELLLLFSKVPRKIYPVSIRDLLFQDAEAEDSNHGE